MYAARTIAQGRVIRSSHLLRPRFVSSLRRLPPRSRNENHGPGYILAGAAGAATVLGAGYAYYHFSGLRNVVATAKSIHASVKSATSDFINNAASTSPYVALSYLRIVAKSYAAAVPGAGFLVDSAFDNINDLARTHGDDVNRIVQRALNELATIAKDTRADIAMVVKVAQVLKSRGEELTYLAIRVASAESTKLLRPLFEEHPVLKEQLSGAWNEMCRAARKSRSPETVKMVKDATAQVVEILKHGLSGESIDQARRLLREKSDEIRKTTVDSASIGARQARDTWDKAVQSARPYLDKVPSIKSIIEENAPFLSSPAASASAISILDELRGKMASHADRRGSGETMSDEKVQRLREYVTRKIDKVRQKNQDLDDDPEEDMMRLGPWEGMKIYVESGAVDQQETPDLTLLSTMAQQDSEEAKKLARETYADVLTVLNKRIEEANSVASSVRKDSKGDT